jgi:multidrug resistance efflux pump
VDDARLSLRELLAVKARPENLRAPVDGVIAATKVVSGQVVAQSNQLFHIIGPTSLLIEARPGRC